MDPIDKTIKTARDVLAKGISTSTLDGGAGSSTLTSRQNLDPVIPSIADRNIPFYDMVNKEDGYGAGITFNLRRSLYSSSHNPRDAVYADGGLPQQRTSQYYTQYKAYRSVGLDGSVTGLAQAVGAKVLDLYAQEVEATSRSVLQDVEWLGFWGSETTLNAAGLPQPVGLDAYITTNVIDAAGAPISKALIDSAASRISEYGGMATHMFTSLRVKADLNNLYGGTERVIINQGDRSNITVGNIAQQVDSVAGVIKFVPDFFINPGNTYPVANGSSSTPLGATTSTVFITNMAYVKLSLLQRLGMEELGRTADKREFYVNAYYAMELTAEPWFAKIINVKDNTIT